MARVPAPPRFPAELTLPARGLSEARPARDMARLTDAMRAAAQIPKARGPT